VNRKKNGLFWDLIVRVKNKEVVVVEDMEGKWLTVVVKDKNNLTKSLYRSKTKKKEAYFILLYIIFFIINVD